MVISTDVRFINDRVKPLTLVSLATPSGEESDIYGGVTTGGASCCRICSSLCLTTFSVVRANWNFIILDKTRSVSGVLSRSLTCSQNCTRVTMKSSAVYIFAASVWDFICCVCYTFLHGSFTSFSKKIHSRICWAESTLLGCCVLLCDTDPITAGSSKAESRVDAQENCCSTEKSSAFYCRSHLLVTCCLRLQQFCARCLLHGDVPCQRGCWRQAEKLSFLAFNY